MLKNTKVILAIVFILIVCIVVGIELNNYITNNTLEELEMSIDRSLNTYYNSEALAKTYTEVLTITNDTKYQIVKNKLYYSVSGEIQDSLFQYETYPLEVAKSVECNIKSINGSLDDSIYIFKVECEVTSEGYSRNLVLLIKIEDEIIQEVITL